MSDKETEEAVEETPAAEVDEAQEKEGGDVKYENAQALTGFNAAPHFNRQKTLMIIAISFVVIIMAGIIFSTQKSSRRKAGDDSGRAAAGSRDFLRREMERNQNRPEDADTGDSVIAEEEERPALPEVTQVNLDMSENTPAGNLRSESASSYPPPPSGTPPYSGGASTPPFTAHLSPLVPIVERAGQGAAGKPQTYAEMYPYTSNQPQTPSYTGVTAGGINPYAGLGGGGGGGGDYAQQNNQADKRAFYDSNAQGALSSGYFLGDNALWIGTIIPAVLETAVNTDLPGNIVARVSQNIYDSRTGKKLLIPQGTLLTAKYNSSVSYAQKRIQIVWDFLTRPDGFAVELDGMNAVDQKGRSGATAQYHENWFEYAKAAWIISMFSVANSKMAEAASRYAGSAEAHGIVAANAEFMNQVGGNLVSRAMNIQPTLTLDSGEQLNVMLNKTMYLPPLDPYQPVQKYIIR